MKKLLITMTMALAVCLATNAQRMQQALGRGVVAVQNGTSVMVTWRRLAQEPEDATWNVYVKKKGAATFTLLNGTPQTNTNYKTTISSIPTGSEVAVAMIDNRGGNQKEGELSKPFAFKSYSMRNIFVEISFAASPLKQANYTTKFVWPCDLNGDGEYDYVVSRCPVDGTRNYYVEGYLADGTFLWNIDLGVNEKPCDGQNDNMCAYDIDCDGYGELIVQTSDGTRFWDKTTGTWGKYILGKDTGDSDGDGIIDYDTQSSKNPPRYMTVVDGMTGAEKASAEFLYDDAYNRTNKASLMGDEYNKHEAHVAVFYHDGIHPAICGEWLSRRASDKVHMYRNCAFAYDFDSAGNASNWHQLFKENIGGAEFHMIRVFDADGDGKDEMSSGAYVMDNDGKTLYNTGISHGDRHRTTDIDPERPGLETFSIQQNAPDMLAQILFDAGTGEPIKKWYLPAVGDVGRGDCADIDPSHLGWEMYSTMDGYQVFDAKGNKIEGKYGVFPVESMWWDGDLDRERLDSPDGNGFNAMVVDFQNGRLFEIAKEAGWTVKSNYGTRADYWGDIIGDWREEVILNRFNGDINTGIVGYSTDIATTVNNIYCLQQDSHYRMDCTTRGYYQTPCPSFYLGYNMPRPQLPPCIVPDSKNQLFDLTLGNATVKPTAGVENIYLMPVKAQTITVDASTVTGSTKLWKSQQGTAILNGNSTTNAAIVVSEGTLQLNGTVAGAIDLRARGTLSGSGTIGSITLEGALNYEGCRLMPNGTLTIDNDLTIDQKTYAEIDIDGGSHIKVNKNLSITAPLIFTVVSTKKAEGEYKLIEFAGKCSYTANKLSARGMTGLSYDFTEHDNAIWLRINGQRDAASGVAWTGSTSTTWDYQTQNWQIDGDATTFVAGDSILFNDAATRKTIAVADLMPIGHMEVNNTATFTFSGNGGFSGSGSLIKNGTGRLTLNTVKSDYTGATIINAGIVAVKELADGGIPSCFGAASKDAANLQIGKAQLIINNTNTATDRGITLNDTATITVSSGTASLKGIIKGNGILKKTGGGQINIIYAGTNQWAGTILNGGTLAMGAWNTTFGRATSPIHVTGNATITMFDQNTTSAIPNIQNVITIDTLKTLTFNAGSRCTVRGSLLGKGTIKMNFPYVRGDVSTDVSKFEGVYDVMTSNCRFVQGMDFSKATLKLESGAYAAGFKGGSGTEQAYANKVGRLRGTGTLGTGTWTVSDLAVEDGGTQSTIGTLTVNGTLVIPDGATVNVRTYTTSSAFKNDAFACNGNVRLTSPHFNIKELSSVNTFKDYQEINVFSGSGSISLNGKATFTPVRPKNGWVWDTSKLALQGIITVSPAPYILGDADRDGDVTMADANFVVNYYLGMPCDNIDLEASDVDGDGKITMSDANAIVNIYLEE